MVKIRLQRIGVKNKPKYRIVVSEEKTKRDGNVIEIIGSFDPNVDPPKAELKKERFQHWIVFGAQATAAVKNLVKRYERAN
ncbi:MAG: 30S ribosomal protein S16 [Candidatus Woykebacteria bacterium RBG_13_40_15]|uniref:Small ribosomal subunit protein bS16 n=1 Tax=Candidatus Woykebacteria bacterium RBG_13_40_15 TaxID=1802593 RepID=A0A1G1W6W8_9BACT|nr:MAG: 30S ribosomal protein S16 [Candidatus Woykebacteria bacterium RBG_13_40_15]